MTGSYAFVKLRRLFWTSFYRVFRGQFFAAMGRGCVFDGFVDVFSPKRKILLGSGVCVYRHVHLLCLGDAHLEIGDRVFIGPQVLISCHQEVRVGANTLIAEQVSIHDNNHVHADTDRPIAEQGFSTKPVVIGEDVWIGAHAVILAGVHVGSHAVIGAGTVVTRDVPEWAVVAGNPGRVVRWRKGEGAP